MHLSEKKIYEAWKRRFAYPSSPLESQAAQSLGKVKSVRKTSRITVCHQIKKAKLIFVGDDASLPQQLELIRDMVHNNGSALVISNRTSQQTLHFRKKFKLQKAITIHKKSIQAENAAFQKAVKKNIGKYKRIFVWTGHLRVSSDAFQKMFSLYDPLFICLQCNELRWNFPKYQDWVTIHDRFLANVSTSPLVSVDYYRSMDEMIPNANVEARKDILLIQKILSKLLKQNKYAKPSKIISIFEKNSIHALNRLKFAPNILRFIQTRVMLGESAVLPEQKLMLLSTQNQSHLVEEAAHYMRLAGRQGVDFGRAGIVVEEALAFFASRLLFPDRPVPRIQKKTDWDVVHSSGYMLGLKLEKLWRRSASSQRLIQKIWIMYPTNRFDYGIMLSLIQDLK